MSLRHGICGAGIAALAALAISSPSPAQQPVTPTATSAQRPGADSRTTAIYFVRHGEVDPTQPTFPLNAQGTARAEAFAQTVSRVRFTHIFSSHTTRSLQMVEPVAKRSNLVVRQLPQPGSRLGGNVVSDSTPARAAIAPLVDALRSLQPGSTALVGVNSDNIYAVLNGLGVPAGTASNPCTSGTTCVPCLTRDCFPGGEDQLWILLVGPDDREPKLIELRYAVTLRAP